METPERVNPRVQALLPCLPAQIGDTLLHKQNNGHANAITVRRRDPGSRCMARGGNASRGPPPKGDRAPTRLRLPRLSPIIGQIDPRAEQYDPRRHYYHLPLY